MVHEVVRPGTGRVTLPAGDRVSAVAALSKLGHELRGPLTGIVGLTGLMSRKVDQGAADPVQQARQLKMLRGSAAELLGTVERIADLARFEQAGPPGEPADVSSLVREVVADFASAAEARGRRVHLDRSDETVTGPADEVRRLLTELLDNAIKYADRPDVYVTVRNGTVEVRDEGPGLTDPDRLLLPFERGEVAGEPGAGLGLCLAQRLSARIGATLSMTTSPDGTAVVVALPARA